MPRIRSIKPGFFTNDSLAEVHPLGRLLFSGLWCHADRSGRLEDRPRKLKAEILPYDDCDIGALLDDLAARGFVIRYEVGGVRYLQVVNFGKHQTPNIKEIDSTIPPPASTVLAQYEHDAGDIPESHLTVLGTVTEQVQVQEQSWEGVQGEPPPPAADPPAPVPLLPRAAPKPTKGPPPKLLALFERQFWPAWPKRVGRSEALSAFVKLGPTEEDVGRMVAAIPEQSEALDWPRENYRYCPNPATWLNQRRWEDEPPQPGPSDSHRPYAPAQSAQVSDRTLSWLKASRSAD